MSRRLFWIYLRDIREGIAQAQSFVGGMTYDEFTADDKTVRATERALEIIGEATKRLPEELKALDTEVPWTRTARMSDFIPHEEDRVRFETVWQAVHTELPPLAPRIVWLEGTVRRREEGTEGE